MSRALLEDQVLPDMSIFDGPHDAVVNEPRFTDAQRQALLGIIAGSSPFTACKQAGYAAPTDAARRLREHPLVAQYLRVIYDHLQKEANIDRKKISKILTDAVDMARTEADPTAMIRGGAELGKLHGLYAPEVKKLELSGNKARLKTALEGLSTEELLDLAGDEDGISIVDGDFEEVVEE